MIVVSDTSAITSLIQVDSIALLHQLYGAILIPPAVARELRLHHSALPAFIEVVPIHDHEAAVRLMLEINSGGSGGDRSRKGSQSQRIAH